MTLRILYASFFAALALVASALFLGGQRLAFADDSVPPVPVSPCEDVFPHIPGMPGCDGETDEDDTPQNPPVNPCDDVFPHIPNMPDCGDEDDNGGDSDAACEDGVDNDGDSLVDSADPGCSDENDTDETDPTGGGGGDPACRDGNDNDGDGKTDMDDPGCANADDSDETDPSSGGGGGGGGSVLGTTTPSCDTHITTFVRMGQKNDPEQVKRIQNVLKSFEGADLEESGEYDDKSEAAVRAFQLKYAEEILTPWGIKQPTGYVFLTTRKKLNEVYCKNTKMFPLTTEETQHIETIKNMTHMPKAISAAPATPAKPKPEATPEKPQATTTVKEEPKVTGNRISDFFRRLFDRFR